MLTRRASQFEKIIILLVTLVAIQLVSTLTPTAFPTGIPNYLGWHTLMELASAVVSIMVFVVGFNNKNARVSGITIFLSCSFLAVGVFDLLHTLSYVGMPDFVTPNSTQKHLTFWLAARVICAVALLIAAVKNWGPFVDYVTASRLLYAFTGVSIVAGAMIGLHEPDILPVWFVPELGLTSTKKAIEYAVIVLHCIAAFLFFRRMNHKEDDKMAPPLLFAAACILGIGELYFTMYSTMIGGYNILGHLYKVLAYMFIYKALIGHVFETPYRELEESNIRILQLINYDKLTNLPNKQLLADRVGQLVASADRTKQQFAIFFIDLDNFKTVNDTMGHRCGDELLIEVANRLTNAVRKHDTVSRVGGDEFVLLIQDVDHTKAATVAGAIIDCLSAPHAINDRVVLTTPSIGIALYGDDGQDFATLYQHADIAMYTAKDSGKCKFAFFTQHIQNQLDKQLHIESQLRSAIGNNELCLYYQPQILLKDSSLVGAEALIRWNSATLGFVSPAEFIPIAEKTGQIIVIGEWVIQTAISQLKLWSDMGIQPGVVSVNVSASQFGQHVLSDRIKSMLQEANVDPSRLGIELTESVASSAENDAISTMGKLYENGLALSIDDFGTGHSSLSLLKKFKISKLKIDQSFVRNITNDPDDEAIVTAIIRMANSLGFSTVAEGVETQDQADLLKKLGCDAIQGYLVSRPIPAAKFEEFIRKHTLP